MTPADYSLDIKKGANAYDKIKSRKKIKHWHKEYFFGYFWGTTPAI